MQLKFKIVSVKREKVYHQTTMKHVEEKTQTTIDLHHGYAVDAASGQDHGDIKLVTLTDSLDGLELGDGIIVTFIPEGKTSG